MKTDSILEDLYAVRAQLIAQAGNDFDQFFDQRLARQNAAKQQNTRVQWIDFSKQILQNANGQAQVLQIP